MILELVSENASAISALVGVIMGATLSYWTNRALATRDLKLRLREKVLDRRIQAHEQVIELTKSLRTMISLGFPEESGELARIPYFFRSQEDFQHQQVQFYSVHRESSTWLSTELTRELNFLQDYFVNLEIYVHNLQPDALPSLGRILRQDFIEFSASIEKKAYQFFEQDLEELKLSSLSEWHKYPRDVSEERLHQTALMTRSEEIQALFDNDR